MAGRRLRQCREALAKYGLHFPPLYFGTLNVALDQPFPTPNLGILIPEEDLEKVAPGWHEWWRLIPVETINGEKIPGYVFRAGQHAHGDRVAELITVDIRAKPGFELSPGAIVKLSIEGEPTPNPIARPADLGRAFGTSSSR